MTNLRRIGCFVAATSLLAPSARADEKAICLDAATKGQRHRDLHRLVEAREQFRICASAGCPAVVQSDCGGWLQDVERELPTVVLSAKNADGADLVEVKVTMDGQPFASKLDGQAAAVNPGAHTFRFEGPAGASFERRVVVREGERSQPVAVVLAAGPATTVAAPALTAPSAEPRPSSSPWRSVGWVVGGVGAAGMATGLVVGAFALGDRSAHCDAGNACDPGTASAIKSAALAADVALIAGGVLAASGLALVLLSPKGHPEPGPRAVLVPTMGRSGGGFVARADW
jgi:hypothetical protein